MSNLIDVYTNFLVSISNLEWFQWLLAAICIFGVILLIRKIVFA